MNGLEKLPGASMALMFYLLTVNIITFFIFAEDKRRAVIRRNRISEKTLILVSVLGGAAGALAAMHTFKHKTRKVQFLYGIPLILAIQIIAVLYIMNI